MSEYRIGPWLIRPAYHGGWEYEHEGYNGPGDGSPEERDDRCGEGQDLAEVLEQITELGR